MSGPRFSVVIPTRERATTLEYALQTCVAQNYDNLEIIVSDNASADATRDVVGACRDPRVKYVNTGSRLSMTDNFEFGYGAVTGDWVFYLGDDDALLEGAIEHAARFMPQSRYHALSWNKVQFDWPFAEQHGSLRVPLDDAVYAYETRQVLKHALWFVQRRLWFPWTRLPVIMNSFVSNAVLARLKERTGRLFWSTQPDVFSGFAIASQIDEYLFSLRPYSVNGGSQFSNGRSSSQTGQRGQYADQFAVENSASPSIPDGTLHVRGSIISCVLEAVHYANRKVLDGRIQIDYGAFYDAIADELSAAQPEIYERGVQAIAAGSSRHGGHSLDADAVRRRHPNRPAAPQGLRIGVSDRGTLDLDPIALGLTDVSQASSFASKLLPPYPDLARPSRYQPLGRLFARLYRAVANRVADRAL